MRDGCSRYGRVGQRNGEPGSYGRWAGTEQRQRSGAARTTRRQTTGPGPTFIQHHSLWSISKIIYFILYETTTYVSPLNKKNTVKIVHFFLQWGNPQSPTSLLTKNIFKFISAAVYFYVISVRFIVSSLMFSKLSPNTSYVQVYNT